MKIFLVVLGLICVRLVSSQVQMDVKIHGKHAGKATLKQLLRSDGSKFISIVIEFKSVDTKTVTVRQESEYDKEGKPQKKLQEIIQPGSKPLVVSVKFDSIGAHAKIGIDKKAIIKTIKLPKDGKIANPSEFWFLNRKPVVGSIVKYLRYDMMEHKWVPDEVKYNGMKAILLGSKTVQAHILKSKEATIYLDDQGDPLILETSSITMTRSLSSR